MYLKQKKTKKKKKIQKTKKKKKNPKKKKKIPKKKKKNPIDISLKVSWHIVLVGNKPG